MRELKTERIEFGDGWWEFYTEVTRGMRKRFRDAAMQTVGGSLNGDTDITDPEQYRTLVLTHPERLNLHAIDDAYLVVGTKAWSFKHKVTVESIDNLPDEYVEKVLVRMRELYAEMPEEARKN